MNYLCPFCFSTNLIARCVQLFDPRTGDELPSKQPPRCKCKNCGLVEALDEFDADAVGYAIVGEGE
jgi:hypothetical protein